MAKQLALTDVSHRALMGAARNAMAGALAGDFPEDPVIGPDLSRAMSTLGSVVKRHGGLIELGIAGALVASDRYLVLTNVTLPVTKAAAQLLDAKNSEQALAKIKLSADSEAEGIVNVDLVVVDPDARWAGAYEIKRGNGATEHGKRRPIMRKLSAARLVLASYVRQAGYGTMEMVTSGVIDYYGASGFAPDFTLSRDQLDAHFGVPVVATVEAMTAALHEALQDALPCLFGPFLAGMTAPDTGDAGAIGDHTRTTDVVDHSAMEPSILKTLTSPPKGPGYRLAQRSRVRSPAPGEARRPAH
jgi:hypothetical protein